MANLPQQLIEHPLAHHLLVELVPGIRRLVATNQGPMTGPGTNTYIIGSEQLAVLDPGPLDAAHVQELMAAGHICWVIVTHTHPDHSPNARALADLTGAQLIGMPGPEDGHQDKSFVPDVALIDGYQLVTPEFTLQAVHTPGHVANHFCFWHERSGFMFTGDHVMQGATVVIIPPSGDMKDYVASVEKLAQFPIVALAPGHGHLMGQAQEYLSALIAHRLAREAKIIAAMARVQQPLTLAELTPLAYGDVDVSLHAIAAYSLWAHLIKLEKEGRVRQYKESHWLFDQAHWQLAESVVKFNVKP
ncbi:MBL fold metallo-hydrolase [Simiduia litorea]|uniref:MBL fold metallo-hydrolase n=1 Tax=Simiduia litorea TaxID=1435348 RepID=UPI0036F27918